MRPGSLTRAMLSIFVLVAVGIALQEPQPIPPFEGDGNPSHEGQPSFCINVDTKEYVHNCSCRGMVADNSCGEEGGGESSRCSVFCRKHACKCVTDCKTE